MKMVKTLLLSSAAGLVAVTAGQAADLPVKAKPVEYVKVCSLYGAGFYYMPGTDLCIKVGGWVRAEAGWGLNGSLTGGPWNGALNQRTTSNEAFRARGYITADVRNQTEYGTVRGYIAVGLNTNDVGLQVASLVDSANRAFVQWAGMTAGLSQSFFDFYSVPAMGYYGLMPASDTGDGGWWVWAYTAQFGGGFSGTISTEARRTTQIIDGNFAVLANGATGSGGILTPGSFFNAVTAAANPAIAGTALTASGAASLLPGAGAYGGMQTGDIVANLRVDQAWGGAQLMGALHEVNASYFSATATGAPSVLAGHPSDQWGWAAGFGLKVNTPFIGQGDWFQAQVNVTEGALRYIFQSPNFNWGMARGNTEAFGVLSDCVYGGSIGAGNTTGCNMTSAWGINVGYEHYWTPQWHTSLTGGYDQVMYGTTANNILCSAMGGGNGNGAQGSAAVATAGCNNNWSTWGVASRTQWDITKTFYIGVEVLYQQMQTAQTFNGLLPAPVALGGVAATGNTANESNWAVRIRAHRDFLP
jgi:hypothetical protein